MAKTRRRFHAFAAFELWTAGLLGHFLTFFEEQVESFCFEAFLFAFVALLLTTIALLLQSLLSLFLLLL
jgi:hypothetical protein